MKPASAQLIALLQTSNFLIGDLYKFTLNSGATDYFTSIDVPVSHGGHIYKSNGLRIEGLTYKIAIGLEVDEQTIRIAAYPDETLCGEPFLSAVAKGLLDGAYILRSRAFWQRTTGVVTQDYGFPPIGVVDLSNMAVSEVSKLGRTHVEVKVKSPTKLLNQDMPRNFFSPGCSHILYDSGCTLVKASFGTNGSVGASPQLLTIPWSGGVPHPTGADGLPYFAQGRLLFTNGSLNGQQVLIENNDGANLYLSYPLTTAVVAGETFTAYAGCSKTQSTCTAKFNNLEHFRGFPFVPPLYVAV
jgi:uncharacterized phage protein (TIGR02218 family)